MSLSCTCALFFSSNYFISPFSLIQLTIMDTGSRERFQSLTAQYYKRNHVIILVCSLDSEYFLTRLAKWYIEAQYYVEDPNVIYALAATKSDLPTARREVTRDALLEFAEHYNIREEHVFEVSAATGEGVDDMLTHLCEAVIERFTRGSQAVPLGHGSRKYPSMLSHYSIVKQNMLRAKLLVK